MALLKGRFDPSLLNATVLQDMLRKILAEQFIQTGEVRTIDVCQQLIDRLEQEGIIQ